jgi:hypothetical protein
MYTLFDDLQRYVYLLLHDLVIFSQLSCMFVCMYIMHIYTRIHDSLMAALTLTKVCVHASWFYDFFPRFLRYCAYGHLVVLNYNIYVYIYIYIYIYIHKILRLLHQELRTYFTVYIYTCNMCSQNSRKASRHSRFYHTYEQVCSPHTCTDSTMHARSAQNPPRCTYATPPDLGHVCL